VIDHSIVIQVVRVLRTSELNPDSKTVCFGADWNGAVSISPNATTTLYKAEALVIDNSCGHALRSAALDQLSPETQPALELFIGGSQ
jgi:hypothetical protein